MRVSRLSLIVATAGVAALLVEGAGAATYTFIPTATATWNDALNWRETTTSANAIPGSADVAGASSGGTAVIDSVVPTVNDVRWANAAAGSDATLNILPGGKLTVLSTNGTNNGSAYFGRASGKTGTLNMSGGELITGALGTITNNNPGLFVIGDVANATGSATGNFNFSGGTVTVGNDFRVGDGRAAGGTTAAPILNRATGNVTQTGGTINIVGAVEVGGNGFATYTMSAGALNQQGAQPNLAPNGVDQNPFGRDAFYVARGAGSVATFNQSGTAVVSIANGMYIGNSSSSNVTTGTVVANSPASTGTYNISSGTLTIAGEMKVGASTNSANSAISGNTGAFNIIGNAAPAITANSLIADTSRSTLGFTIGDAAGATLLSLTAGSAGGVNYTGNAVLSHSTKLELDPLSGFTPVVGSTFELVRAPGGFSGGLPNLIADGDAFDAYHAEIRDNGNGTFSLVAAPGFFSSTWTGLGSDAAWSTDANWSNGAPGGPGHIAVFSSNTAPVTSVTNTTNKTVGTIHFSATTAYTLAGPGTVTLHSGLANTAAAINVDAGSHVINAPIVMATDLTVTSGASTNLSITSPITGGGHALAKAGAGTAELASLSDVSLAVNGGTLRVTAKAAANDPAGVSKVTALSVATGAALDLTNNAMIIDYTGDVGTQLTDVRSHLAAGRIVGGDGGERRIGYADNATRTTPFTTVGGVAADPSSILMLNTFGGDANLDGAVAFPDLVVLAQNYNKASGAIWTEGDFDYNGAVAFSDLVILAQNYNKSGLTTAQLTSLGSGFAAEWAMAQSLVPEPTSLATLAVGGLMLRRRRA